MSLVAAKSQARLLRDHLEAVGKGVAEAAKIIKWQSNEAVNVENDAKMPIEDVDIKVEEIDCCMDIPGDVAAFHVKTELEDNDINLHAKRLQVSLFLHKHSEVPTTSGMGRKRRDY